MITFLIAALSVFLIWYATSGGGSPLDVFTGKLGADQISQFAANAGFSGDDLQTAVAVALAESGGDPKAYNPETGAGTAPGRGSYGLWQIYQTAHPEFDSATLFDPQGNAYAAYAVYSQAGGSFSPWSTFNSGIYQNFLGRIDG